jgi:isoleucyl-tRNA synthetase
MGDEKLKIKNEEKQVVKKSEVAEREESTLAFWNEKKTFEKTLIKTKAGKPFVFYDGPPFATGLPHYGHLLQGTMKDAVPRYQTMNGRFVRRVWGWDCHGLPIENLIEDELGLKNKQEIISYGIEKFNEAARNSVLRYNTDWKRIVPRMGRFVDMEKSYKTMDWQYSESIWWAFKTLYDKKLIYKGYKSMHICPRCETTLSNNEVADGYKDIKDISVIAKFELTDPSTGSGQGVFVLAWTTTPWTLPGNVALAVGKDIKYGRYKIKSGERAGETYIVAESRATDVFKNVSLYPAVGGMEEIAEVAYMTGNELVGKSYKPLFDYYAKDITLENHANGWKIYAADFVTTEDGTGVVHIAPAFGEDDMNLGKEQHLPFIQHVAMNGHFKKEVTDFPNMSVKPKSDDEKERLSTDIAVIKYLQEHGTFFDKKKFEHAYPHCWRCKTPLLNYAADSWFVKVGGVKEKMIEENNKVGWIPDFVGRSRFGNWLEGARDWAISRTRFWGAPFPVWMCDSCETVEVVGGIDELKKKLSVSGNSYWMMRHGESENNVEGRISVKAENPDHLTEKGKKQAEESAKKFKAGDFDMIISSPFVRTKETAEIMAKHLGIPATDIIFDERIGELRAGDFDGKFIDEYHGYFKSMSEKFTKPAPNGETLTEMKNRFGEFLFETESKYKGKKILFVTHEYGAWMLTVVAKGNNPETAVLLKESFGDDFYTNAQVGKLDFAPFPHNRNFEVDLHRPYIDEINYPCACGKGTMKRVPDVFDCWFESGSMPYAQFHYPFENKEEFDKNFPADFIAEGLDQTRGWFYTLLVLGSGLFGKSPYKNVIVSGLVLAEDGQKMSKSLKNYPDPMDVVEKYGADALRYYMLSSQIVRGEPLNFSEKGVGDVYRKVVVRLMNVLSFYELYAGKETVGVLAKDSPNVLDVWIIARLQETLEKVSAGFDGYELDKATRPIGDFVEDLSTWYLRRSRTRFKGDDTKDAAFALATTRFILEEFSKIIAPVMPFVAEFVYQKVKSGSEESVHETTWPVKVAHDPLILELMQETRNVVSLALEVRASSAIKVRQPLQSLTVRSQTLNGKDEFLELIKDEVNVKEVLFDESIVNEAALDLVITETLKREGYVRELIRNIQDLRKKNGFTPEDMVVAIVETDTAGKDLIETYREEISKATLLSGIDYEKVATEEEGIIIDELQFTIVLRK